MKNNQIILLTLAAVAAVGVFAMTSQDGKGTEAAKPSDGELIWSLEPGTMYIIRTVKDGEEDYYREEVGETQYVSYGQTMRNGGTLVLVELESEVSE